MIQLERHALGSALGLADRARAGSSACGCWVDYALVPDLIQARDRVEMTSMAEVINLC